MADDGYINQVITDDIQEVFRENISPIKREMNDLDILFFWPEDKVECPNCALDPLNNCSSGVYAPKDGYVGTSFTNGQCPICNGSGYTKNYLNKRIRGTVYYFDKTERESFDGGYFDQADAELSFVKDDTMCNSGANSGHPYYDFAEYVTFDDQKWEKKGVSRPGGIGKRYIVAINYVRTNK